MPPTGSVLLDTNILIALLAGELAAIGGLRAADVVYIAAIALGELYYGAHRSGRPAANLERVAALAAVGAVLPCDAGTAASYGTLKAALRAQGTPIPENDIWIAAIALQHALTLVSRDAHFGQVPGLELERWV